MQWQLGNSETTSFLQFSVWWAYAVSVLAGIVACIVSFFCALARVLEAVGDQNTLSFWAWRTLNHSNLELGFWSFPVLLLMIFLRVLIGLAMMLCGFRGWYMVTGGNPSPLLTKLKSETYSTFFSHSLSGIALFADGQFATLSVMSQALLRAAESFPGHHRGGVAMAAIGACVGFGAICGSRLPPRQRCPRSLCQSQRDVDIPVFFRRRQRRRAAHLVFSFHRLWFL